MKLIVDVPKKYEQWILEHISKQDYDISTDDLYSMSEWLLNGIPLPEHHGDLADKGDILHDIDCDEEMRLGKNVEWVREVIRNAPTIIKASEEGAVG